MSSSNEDEEASPEEKLTTRIDGGAHSSTPKFDVPTPNPNKGEGPRPRVKIMSRSKSKEEGPPPETVRFKDTLKCPEEDCEVINDDIIYQNIEEPPDRCCKLNPNAKFQHFPKFSKYHPIIPRRYVQGWKNDMKNRFQLMSHAVESRIYPGAHDESLFLKRRERINHGEGRCCIERKIESPDRFYLLHPLFYHHLSKYQSGLMYRFETKIPKCSCQKE